MSDQENVPTQAVNNETKLDFGVSKENLVKTIHEHLAFLQGEAGPCLEEIKFLAAHAMKGGCLQAEIVLKLQTKLFELNNLCGMMFSFSTLRSMVGDIEANRFFEDLSAEAQRRELTEEEEDALSPSIFPEKTP